MTTATEQMIRESEENKTEYDLHRKVEWFVGKWSPTHRRVNETEEFRDYHPAEFEADLFMLIRSVHADASRPFHAMLRNAIAAAPLLPFSVREPRT